MLWQKLKTFLGNIYTLVWSRNGFTVGQQCPVTNVWAHLPLKLWNLTWMTNRIKLIVCPQIKPFLSFHFNTLAWLTFAIDSKNTFLFVWVSGCYSNASFHLTILPKCPSPKWKCGETTGGFSSLLNYTTHLKNSTKRTSSWCFVQCDNVMTKLLEACNFYFYFFDKALCETASTSLKYFSKQKRNLWFYG